MRTHSNINTWTPGHSAQRTVDTMDKVHTLDKEKKTQDKGMKTCTDTRTDTCTRENTCIYIKNKKTEYKNKKKRHINAPVKQCITSFARCMLWRYVQPYVTMLGAHPDIYITVWGSIDTHRYIYIIYNNNIYFYALL